MQLMKTQARTNKQYRRCSVGDFYVLPLVGGNPHFVDSSASKLLSAWCKWVCFYSQHFFLFLLGEPPLALRRFEPVGTDYYIFLLLFLFWLCNPYAGISRLVLFVFAFFQTDIDTNCVCCFLFYSDPPKVPWSLGQVKQGSPRGRRGLSDTFTKP